MAKSSADGPSPHAHGLLAPCPHSLRALVLRSPLTVCRPSCGKQADAVGAQSSHLAQLGRPLATGHPRSAPVRCFPRREVSLSSEKPTLPRGPSEHTSHDALLHAVPPSKLASELADSWRELAGLPASLERKVEDTNELHWARLDETAATSGGLSTLEVRLEVMEGRLPKLATELYSKLKTSEERPFGAVSAMEAGVRCEMLKLSPDLDLQLVQLADDIKEGRVDPEAKRGESLVDTIAQLEDQGLERCVEEAHVAARKGYDDLARRLESELDCRFQAAAADQASLRERLEWAVASMRIGLPAPQKQLRSVETGLREQGQALCALEHGLGDPGQQPSSQAVWLASAREPAGATREKDNEARDVMRQLLAAQSQRADVLADDLWAGLATEQLVLRFAAVERSALALTAAVGRLQSAGTDHADGVAPGAGREALAVAESQGAAVLA
ncbi:unnamed protein product [Prorocentrum cordatum]|uniref:Uncharacterized protein n=1 Tax=Prorocentrum cordatum TaxID=2364126 RepID=A0ABN9W302_9DINO|nr:unnamed protein product [Polarella glacialis]